MILHVITNFTARAGAEKMLARLLCASDGSGIMVVSLMEISEHNKASITAQNVQFVALGAQSLPGMVVSLFKLVRLIRRDQPKVILCWMYHAMAIGTFAHWMAARPSALYWTVRQSLDDKASLSRSTRIAVWLCKRLSRWPDGIIYNSSRAMELHHKDGFANEASVFIPNGFDLPTDITISDKSPRVFGIAGRLHAQKDHETFFKAAGLAAHARPDLRFIAAGDGLEHGKPVVTKMIADAAIPSDQFALLGEVGDMASFYRSIDVLVLSSRTEGFPNVVAEAMSHARPVITTDVGDAAHIVGETGVVVSPRDADGLAEAISSFSVLDATQYRLKCEHARARIEEKFSIETVAKDYMAFLTPAQR